MKAGSALGAAVRVVLTLIGAGLPLDAHAQSAQTEPDRYELFVSGETHMELFRRALLPGPRGAVVRTETLAPLNHYVVLRARDLDTAWRADSLDVELAAWGSAVLGEGDFGGPLDGDVQTAFVGYRHGPALFRLGRQHAAGGAARYARFDGLFVEVALAEALQAQAYGGWTVLPRWNERPSFEYLGAAADSDLRAAEALEEPDRLGHWLGGARLSYGSPRALGALSFHEQREHGEIARRNLGAEARAEVTTELSCAGSALLELDSQRLADARLWVDYVPVPRLELALEAQHVEPALFLSRQSVLSVFSTDTYDELGGLAQARLIDEIRVEGGAWLEVYTLERVGSRTEASLRLSPDRNGRTLVRLTYARVVAPENGYHSLRAALSRRLGQRLWSSLEAYGYIYDRAIRGVTTSTVYAGTLSYRPSPAFSALWGASLTRSPYASLDAQTQVRLAYDFDLGTRGQWP